MRDLHDLYLSFSRVRIAHCPFRFAIIVLLLCSSQSSLFAADAPSLLEEIEATKRERLIAEAALHDLRDCIRSTAVSQELVPDAGHWSFDFSIRKFKTTFPFGEATTAVPCLDVECRVDVAQGQLNNFAAVQIDRYNRLQKQIAKLHERLNNIASCIK